MENKSFLANNWDIIIVLIVYTIITGFFIQHDYYKISGDELAYIDIAHAYAVGNWENGINGYWSPLYSWLITPFLLFGSNPVNAVYISKIISLIVGIFTIISVRRLSRSFKMSKKIERSLLFSLIPSFLLFSYLYTTPDMLLVGVIILYLSVIFDPKYSSNYINGILCGLIGATAYLTKSFAFPFFVVHFLLFNLIFFFKSIKIEKKNILKNLFLGLVVFFVVSGLWVGTISEKYGKVTISTAEDYNLALVGPKYQDNTMGNGIPPIYYIGLIKPPNNNTISIWDDPSYIKMDQWSPFDSWDNFLYQMKLVWSNLIYTSKIVEFFMPVAILIIISSLLFILKLKNDIISKDILKYILLTILIYIGGYSLIVPEWRYLWLIFILIMISGFYIVDSLYKSRVFVPNKINILLILLICSFTIQPVIDLASYYAAPNENLYNLSNILKEDYGVEGNIASNNEWMKMFTLSYYINGKYYGITKKTNSKKELQEELEDNNIKYYFVWDNLESLNLSDYHEISNGKIEGLRIYELNN